MDFKQYYRNKLNEEGITIKDSNGSYDLDQDAPKPQQPQAAPADQGKTGLITSYVNGTSMKLGLKKLGEDIGEGIFEYATKQAVTPADFKSEDDYIKYTQEIRTGIEEKYNKTLTELLIQMGIFIDNKIHTQTNK